MPEIDKNSVTNQEWLRNHNGLRFVRMDSNFYFSENYLDSHDLIATSNGVIKKDLNNKPLIDDGGFLQVVKGKLGFAQFSTSCGYKKDVFESRDETYEIAKEVFGEENIF